MADLPEFKIDYDVIDDDLANQKLRIELPEVKAGELASNVENLSDDLKQTTRRLVDILVTPNPYTNFDPTHPPDNPDANVKRLMEAWEILQDPTSFAMDVRLEPNHESLLFLAAMNGHDYAIEPLLKNNVFISHSTEYGLMPIFAAMANGHKQCVKKIVEHDKDMEISHVIPRDYDELGGCNAYHLALLTHQFELAEWMEKEIDSELINYYSQLQIVPTVEAARHNNKQAFDYLTKKGATLCEYSMDPPDLDYHVLHKMLDRSQTSEEMVAHVMEHPKVDVNEVLHKTDNNYQTLLSKAATAGRSRTVDRLLALGANPTHTEKDIDGVEQKSITLVGVLERIYDHVQRSEDNQLEDEQLFVDVASGYASYDAMIKTIVTSLLKADANTNFYDDIEGGVSLAEGYLVLVSVNRIPVLQDMLPLFLEHGMRVTPNDARDIDLLDENWLASKCQQTCEQEELSFDDEVQARIDTVQDMIHVHIQSVRDDITKLPKGAEPSLLVRAYAVGLEGEVIGKFSDAPEAGMALIEQTPKWLQETSQIKQQMTRLGAYAAHAHPGNAVTGWSVETLAEHAQGQGV